jgi:hypothetical protein
VRLRLFEYECTLYSLGDMCLLGRAGKKEEKHRNVVTVKERRRGRKCDAMIMRKATKPYVSMLWREALRVFLL